MAQKCMAGLPPTRELTGLKIPYGAWEPDTLITDSFGNPMFSVLDVSHHAMGAYEAIFGDENGHKLCYVKRRLITKHWKDGWDFCTYTPNFPDQPKYKERDMYGKSVYPFSFLQVRPMKCRYAYSVHKEDLEGMDTHLEAMHGWLGSMTVCCTPMVRFGKWQIDFHRPGAGDPEINIDQSKNLLEVERGNDLLAALCIAYAFDKALCQPLVTIVGYQEKEHLDDDDDSLDSFDPEGLGRAIDPEPPAYPALPAPSSGEDYDEEDTFQPAGYLGYEEEPEQEDEPSAGYLEAAPSSHSDESGYLESQQTTEVAGYLDSEPYNGHGSAGEDLDGLIENQSHESDQHNSNAGLYLEAGDPDVEAEEFHDEP